MLKLSNYKEILIFIIRSVNSLFLANEMILKSKKSVQKNGFTLMEVMLSVSILSMGIVASFALISSSMAKFSTATNKIIAANLAQDGIERVRNARDTNWLKGKTESNSGGNAWDDGIKGSGDEKFIKFSCENGVAPLYLTGSDKPNPPGPGPHSEKDYIEACISNTAVEKKCKIIKYFNGASWNSSAERCISDDTEGAGTYNDEAYLNFYRLIHISENNDHSNKVLVTIKWIDRSGTHYFTAEEILYNWKETN